MDNHGPLDDDVNRRGVLKVLGVGTASLGDGVVSIRDLVLDAARSSAMLRASVETPGLVSLLWLTLVNGYTDWLLITRSPRTWP